MQTPTPYLPAIWKRLSQGGIWLLSLWFWAGCAGYKVGSNTGQPAGKRSVQVNMFVNKTPEPRLVETVTSAVRKRLQQDGSYRLDTAGDGDVIVNGVITHYNRGALSFQPTDILTVRDYTITLTAHITARERYTNRLLMDRSVVGRATIRVGSDLSSAERQAIPMLAEDLARRATSFLVDGDW